MILEFGPGIHTLPKRVAVQYEDLIVTGAGADKTVIVVDDPNLNAVYGFCGVGDQFGYGSGSNQITETTGWFTFNKGFAGLNEYGDPIPEVGDWFWVRQQDNQLIQVIGKEDYSAQSAKYTYDKPVQDWAGCKLTRGAVRVLSQNGNVLETDKPIQNVQHGRAYLASGWSPIHLGLRGQFVDIVEINGTQISIDTPLRHQIDTERSLLVPGFYPSLKISNCTIVAPVNRGHGFPIFAKYCREVILDNVKTYYPTGAPSSRHIEVINVGDFEANDMDLYASCNSVDSTVIDRSTFLGGHWEEQCGHVEIKDSESGLINIREDTQSCSLNGVFIRTPLNGTKFSNATMRDVSIFADGVNIFNGADLERVFFRGYCVINSGDGCRVDGVMVGNGVRFGAGSTGSYANIVGKINNAGAWQEI